MKKLAAMLVVVIGMMLVPGTAQAARLPFPVVSPCQIPPCPVRYTPSTPVVKVVRDVRVYWNPRALLR